MKTALLSRTLICAVILSALTYSIHAQGVTNAKIKADITAGDYVAVTPPNQPPVVGKEIPVAGGVLFVTPAEKAVMQKEIAAKEALSDKEKRRQRKLKKQDRKEVADVIGTSVDTYLANAAMVHTLQRF